MLNLNEKYVRNVKLKKILLNSELLKREAKLAEEISVNHAHLLFISNRIFGNTIELDMSNIWNCIVNKMANVLAVDHVKQILKEIFTSIMTTKQAKLEAFYVLNAILESVIFKIRLKDYSLQFNI